MTQRAGMAKACVVVLAGMAGVAQAVDFNYTLKAPGFVSAAVYDESGRQVRTLQYGAKQDAGEYRLSWDGMDQYGQPQPAANYEWRLLRTPGFTKDFLVDLGTTITWGPHDYWPGNHFGPSSVLVDNDGDLYVGSPSSEGPPGMVKLSQDGSKLLWKGGGLDGLSAMVRIDKVLYIRVGDALCVRRADSGQGFWEDPKLRKFVKAPFADLRHPRESQEKKSSLIGLAGGKDFLVVCYPDFNEVRLLWPRDDTFERDETVTIPHPTAAAVAADGRIFVRSGKSIVMFSDASRGAKPVVSDDRLAEPGPMAYDPAFGDLLVATGSHVRRYHAADGKLVATYGRPEGRTYGVFDPLDFESILSLAADGKGGFFTAELCPRRVAHFTGREQHHLVSEWFGGMPWNAQAILDPEDPTLAFVPIDYKHLGRAKIDYNKKSWMLTHLYDTPETFRWGANAGDQHKAIFPPVTGSGHMLAWQVRHVQGQTFLVDVRDGVMVLRVDEKENRLVPVAQLAALHPTTDRRQPPSWWLEAVKRMGVDATAPELTAEQRFQKAGGYKHFSYAWADTNRNGAFDLDEVVLGAGGQTIGACRTFVDADWNVYLQDTATNTAWRVIADEGKEKGYPVWNCDHIRPGIGAFPANLRATSFYATRDGSVYATGKFADHKTWDMPPLAWPNNASTLDRFLKWDREGRLMFATGFHSPRKEQRPGEFADLRGFVGEAHGTIVLRDACAHAAVWTLDGLYAGGISEPVDRFGGSEQLRLKGPWTDDCQNGQIIETPKGGALWCANDCQNTMVYRVMGWDGWERQSGSLALKAARVPARQQGDGLLGTYFNNPDLQGPPVLTRVDLSISFGKPTGDHFVRDRKSVV